VIFDEELFDATARSGMIDKDTEVVVYDYQNAQLIVDKV
jgi:membrane-bound ClpP family serine protease